VLGTQWGDEGKGKLVDILAQQYDVIARAQVSSGRSRPSGSPAACSHIHYAAGNPSLYCCCSSSDCRPLQMHCNVSVVTGTQITMSCSCAAAAHMYRI
jgi:hypothetical protein